MEPIAVEFYPYDIDKAFPGILYMAVRMGLACPCRPEPVCHYERWTFHIGAVISVEQQFTSRLVDIIHNLQNHLEEDARKGLL